MLLLPPDKLALATASLARNSSDLSDYPAPDLAIEVDLSPSKIDRPGIYAAMQVTEVWRFGTSSVVIERLNEEGGYSVAQSSVFLPVTSDELARCGAPREQNRCAHLEASPPCLDPCRAADPPPREANRRTLQEWPRRTQRPASTSRSSSTKHCWSVFPNTAKRYDSRPNRKTILGS